MRFRNAYVRSTCVEESPQGDFAGLATALVAKPVEVILTAHGASQGTEQLQDVRSAATALARRNIRSLLARNGSAEQVTSALRTAVIAAPRDAEDALAEAGMELNLRDSIYASPDAVLQIEGKDLVISDGSEPTVRIPRTELREAGSKYFGPEAMARLISLDMEAVRFSESAIMPTALQLETGAVMEADTAHERLKKGEWRSMRKPHFIKEYCITCARCFIHCPDNAINHAMFDKSAKDTTGILGIDYEQCTACGLCASVCPANRDGYKAIVMIDDQVEGTPEVHRVS